MKITILDLLLPIKLRQLTAYHWMYEVSVLGVFGDVSMHLLVVVLSSAGGGEAGEDRANKLK